MEEIEKLKTKNERLEKINENKSNIISITSHQLRTSLSALKWILKMLLDEDAGKLTNEQNELVKKAFDSNERMLALVNDLLTFSHSEEISESYNFEEVNLIKVIDQTIFDFYSESRKKEVELIFLKPENDIPHINCDKKMMRIVIQNLIENAIKYSHKGGKVFISIKQKDKNLEISVYDTGIGIDDIDKENIFKKFFRAQNAMDKEIIGSGLGLFVTQNIVKKHNGKIWFESKHNEGTTFFVSLPIA